MARIPALRAVVTQHPIPKQQPQRPAYENRCTSLITDLHAAEEKKKTCPSRDAFPVVVRYRQNGSQVMGSTKTGRILERVRHSPPLSTLVSLESGLASIYACTSTTTAAKTTPFPLPTVFWTPVEKQTRRKAYGLRFCAMPNRFTM
jgi:hypothetical protein